MGTGPGCGLPDGPMPPFEALEHNTFAAFADLDASPTKAWVALHRGDPGMERCFQYAFGRRPAEELYDLRKDPHHMQNVAGEADYAAVQKELSKRLMDTLRTTGDPRVTGDGTTFEHPPYAGPLKKRR